MSEFDEDDDDQVDEESTESTEARWYRYKAECRSRAAEPLTWGAWLAAGQPIRDEEEA